MTWTVSRFCDSLPPAPTRICLLDCDSLPPALTRTCLLDCDSLPPAPISACIVNALISPLRLHVCIVLLLNKLHMDPQSTDSMILDSAALRDMRSVTDLALHATKATAQAIGRLMYILIVLERHLWLTMTAMKEADKVPFLEAPVSSSSLFGPAVDGFAERFMEAQKSSQAMRHFLPKRTSFSSASSRPRPVPTAKPTPTTPEPRTPEGRQDRGGERSARRYPFPKRQGLRPKIAMYPAPQKLS